MDPYITQLKKELAEYEKACSGEPQASVLQFLWDCYAAANPVDSGEVKAAEAAIMPVFQELSFDSSNMLSDLILDLCTTYQRAAFLEGIQVGAHLVEELDGSKL